MAFKLSDFKKTSRTINQRRQIYPYQIRDDRYTASIGYALAYYERMVGKARRHFELDTLLEFFGDPRLARGLVACLAQTYTWREQSFAEALGEPVARILQDANLQRPADLRARWYALANQRYQGVILPAEREQALQLLCDEIGGDGIPPAAIEQALTLDANEQRVLVKIGATPSAEALIARYNYHSLETALCHAAELRIRMRGPIWEIVRSLARLGRRYQLRYGIGDLPRTLFDETIDITLFGGKDALGSWTHHGRRLVRVLLRLLATHPGALQDGEALVHLGSQTAMLKLDDRALAVLGVLAQETDEIGEAWDAELLEQFHQRWSRAYLRGQTNGWRLRRDPEPLASAGTLIVPDFSLIRGNQRLALCLAPSQATAAELARSLAQHEQRQQTIILVPEAVAEALLHCPAALVSYATQPAEAIERMTQLLERRHPRPRTAARTAWQVLEKLVAEDGFVTQAEVAALLECSPTEAERQVARLGGSQFHVLPGLGVCAPSALEEIRQLLDERNAAQRAA